MKNILIASIFILAISACGSAPTQDTESIQNTAIAVAMTDISETQSTVDIVGTLNAQSTQIAELSQPTIAITPTRLPISLNDPSIVPVIMNVIGGNEYDMVYSEMYYDGQLSIGSFFRTRLEPTFMNGWWFIEKNSNGQWVARYISDGLPLCDKIQDFKTQYADLCIDANGNEVFIIFQ